MKKNYYLTLDTETCTLPFADELCKTAKEKQKIAIAKPIVYDIGWTITDRKGNAYKRVSYLVQETFFVPSIFNTAYYKEKRQLYIEKYKRGEIVAKNWNDIMEELEQDLQRVTIATAYNACFDYKKAIPFTEKYIDYLYSGDYENWLRYQQHRCDILLHGANGEKPKNPNYLDSVFILRGNSYPICDLWGIACEKLLNNQKYKSYCLNNSRISASGLYFSTNAESAFQYLTQDLEFKEEHTALSDAIIESQILTKVLKKSGIKPEIHPFPFRLLGSTIDYIEKHPNSQHADTVAKYIENWLDNHYNIENTPFYTMMLSKYEQIF